ncbi:MAG TPA: hypothetical protein VFO31_17720, partial [Vicinamibacterales bacterium]|nr:hypothetical protein [Vicinamibacterales bacterium]
MPLPAIRQTRRIVGAFCLSSVAATGLTVQASRAAPQTAAAQQAPQLGGRYAALDARRQRLVDSWVARLSDVAGQPIEAGPFYDTKVRFSAKTTFEAVTHALITTTLTDDAGARLGDGLDLIERVDAVKGQVPGVGGDRQFRMYALLTTDAVATLERSREFRRGADNTVYHRGYPINFRAQGGTPSIQISIAEDRRNADVDVDYRGSSFPIALFNGHLTSANSDVRAGNNYDRHVDRWTGFNNWWRSFFGIRLDRAPDEDTKSTVAIPTAPKIGKKTVDVMAHEFLRTWLVDGNVLESMAYISERAFACLAEDADNPAAFDRGMAPFRILALLKAAKDAIGPRPSLEGAIAGVRITNPELKVVVQPHHAQFVLYSVPDDVAATLDCESRQAGGRPNRPPRVYGNYYGSLFYAPSRDGALAGNGQTVALLWALVNGYWKIVSWHVEPEQDDTPAPRTPAVMASTVRMTAEADLVQSARRFLESWLVRRDYDAAFKFMSPVSYACYNLSRSPDQPAAASAEDAGRAIRAALERTGQVVGRARRLDALIESVDPVHARIRLVDHPDARVFSLFGLPDAFAEVESCATRQLVERLATTAGTAAQYGKAFGQSLRFRTRSGETPVLRLLWLKESGVWRIAAYDVV